MLGFPGILTATRLGCGKRCLLDLMFTILTVTIVTTPLITLS
jgi:hypothetical protein